MATIVNPATPYVGPVPSGLHDGMQIHVSGVPEQHHNGFAIYLQAGGNTDPRSECAFVFNPRFNESQVIRNTFQSGSWGAEERHGGFPFRKGQPFKVTIGVQTNHYSVSVNGIHFCDYNHRMPKHRVSHITLEQGIRIQSIQFENATIVYPGMQTPPSYNPPVPYVQSFNGLYPGKMIIINGVPNSNPGRISVYIQRGPDLEPVEIAFVIDARFNFGNDRSVIVRNHKQGSWGSEERYSPCFPFYPNTPFEMIILVESHAFKVAVNNQHLLEFCHRMQPLNRMNTLRIGGDVTLTQVRFQG